MGDGMMTNESGLDDWVPRLKRRPDSLVQEEWEALVRKTLPKLEPEDYELVKIGDDPMVFRFDVLPKTGGQVHQVLIRSTDFGENRCDCAAFKHGVYGTCSHIEFALDRLREVHEDSLADLFLQRPYSEIIVQQGPRRKIIFRPAITAPKAVLALARRCFDKQGELILTHLGDLQRMVQHSPPWHHEIVVDEEVFSLIAWMTQKQWRMRDILAAFPKGASTKTFEKLLKTTLTMFQREAAINAAIMGRYLLFSMSGLGKRRTAVAMAEILAQVMNLKRVIVLTRTECLQTWRHELVQSTERKTEVVFGSSPNRSRLYAGDAFYKIARYDDLKEDINAMTGQGRPELLICDEAHTIRRYDSEVARLIRRFESEYLLVLSGSDPVKQPGPFLSFVDMVDPQRIGVLESFLERHQLPSSDWKVTKYVNMNRVSATIPDHYRRDETRTHLRNLPDVIEHFYFLPITAEQGKHHADLQSRLFRLVEPWKESSKTPPMLILHQIQVILDEMFRATSDVSLIDPKKTSGHKRKAVRQILLDRLDTLEARAIVFSHDPVSFDLIGDELERIRLDYVVVDRRMSITQQRLSIQKFERNPECRILLVTDNVTEKLPTSRVHLVIHLDRPWNPDVLRARNRHLSHSSVRPLHACHLISYGTVEHAFFKAADRIDIKIPVDLARNQSVTLLDISQQGQYFEQVKLILEQLDDSPMVLD